MKYQAQTNKPLAKQVSNNYYYGQVFARRVHYPPISNSTLESTVPPAPIVNTVLLMPNRVAPIPTSNGYKDLYFSDSDDNPILEGMVDSKILKPINTYSVVPQPLKLASKPTKVLKK